MRLFSLGCEVWAQIFASSLCVAGLPGGAAGSQPQQTPPSPGPLVPRQLIPTPNSSPHPHGCPSSPGWGRKDSPAQMHMQPLALILPPTPVQPPQRKPL